MRTNNLVVTAMILVGGAACSSSSDTITGLRVDGVKVSCTPQADDVSACTPVDPAQCDTAASVLWPPNHKMIPLTLADCIAVQSGCDGGGGDGSGSGSGGDGILLRTVSSAAPTGLVHMTKITVDEIVDVDAGGDGHTTMPDDPNFDVRITAAGPDAPDKVTFELRSERQGGGDGRVYHVNYVDAAGVAGSCTFMVPHDKGPTSGALDSGELVTVTPMP